MNSIKCWRMCFTRVRYKIFDNKRKIEINNNPLRWILTESHLSHIGNKEDIAYAFSRVLADALCCSHWTAVLLSTRNKRVLQTDFEQIRRTAAFLKEKFNIKDIEKNPEILTIKPSVMEQRYCVLQEMGFSEITVGKIIRFTGLMKKTPHQLSIHGLLPSTLDPIESIAIYLNCPTVVKQLMKVKQAPNYMFSSSMINIKRIVLMEYLAWKFSSSILKVLDILEKYPSLVHKSFQHLEETYSILTEIFEFPISKLMSNGFLLSIHPDNLLDIMNKIPKLGGMDIKEFAIKYPRILCTSADTLLQTEKHLREFQLSDEQIQKYGNVYTLKPETVQARLQEWNNFSECKVMNSYSKVLDLVCHHNIAKERLQLLKSKDFISTSLDVLSLSTVSFSKIIHRDIYISRSKEYFTYLENMFEKDSSKIKKQLKRHPNSSYISPVNVKNVTEFLFQNGITKEQIWQGLPIILYDIKIVAEYFKKIPYYDVFQSFADAKNHFNFIELLLYSIEKDHNFSGEGVYHMKIKSCFSVGDVSDNDF